MVEIEPVSMEEIREAISHAKQYYLVLLKRGPAERNDETHLNDSQVRHLQHLFGLGKAGKLVINGPLLVDIDLRGVSIYACDSQEEVEAYVNADPHIQNGYLVAEIYPWMGRPGSSLP